MNSQRTCNIAPSPNSTINVNNQEGMPSVCKNDGQQPDVETKGTNIYITDHSVKIVFTNDRSAKDCAPLDYGPIEMKNQILKNIADGTYDVAVKLTNILDKSVLTPEGTINGIVQKLLESHSTAKNLMSFAFVLSISGSSDIIRKYFPATFQLIFGQEVVKIVNRGYDQALKLDANADDMNDRKAWGDSKDKTSKRVSWKFLPIWENNEVTFRIYNIDRKQNLKLAVAVDHDGDRTSYGSPNVDTDKHRFYVEPYMKDGELVFYLINYKYKQVLKLIITADSMGDRLVKAQSVNIYSDEGRFKWIISKWEPVTED